MIDIGNKNPKSNLEEYGIDGTRTAYWNLSPSELTKHTLDQNQGRLTDNETLVVNTGKYTGRSPKDRYIVKDDITSEVVDWGDFNKAFDQSKYDGLRAKLVAYLKDKDIYVRDAYACAEESHRLNIRVINEHPWSNMFVYNMFLRPTEEEQKSFSPEWIILNAPGFHGDPNTNGIEDSNFAIINFGRKEIIIGGTGYTGEIKKGIFSVLNMTLPHQEGVLSMHCSANQGPNGDTAVFFGLSGTGKTTLSADPNRNLIGDDEHGWSDTAVFNFEGGCYAKTIDITADKEPEIFAAIRPGAILENIGFVGDSNVPDYTDSSITQNTRVSYPIHFISNALEKSVGGHPKNIFFLTADAYGVLPPISKLSPGQAMYHFISGYTAKVAGTELGVKEPKSTFSACFGAPFLPLHPTYYAKMLGEKMTKHEVKVWMINTGWTGGAYGVGNRIKLRYTRAMITAALNGALEDVSYSAHPVFGVMMPNSCPDVPSEVLNPRSTWEDGQAYDQQAAMLANQFNANFEKFADKASSEILAAAPVVPSEA